MPSRPTISAFPSRRAPSTSWVPSTRRPLVRASPPNYSCPGFARAHFPAALFCYFVAVCIKYLQTIKTLAVIIAPVSLLTWGFFMAYYRWDRRLIGM